MEVVDDIWNGFNDYLREVEKEQNIVITDYIFRDKKAGWGSNFCYSYYNNGDKNKIKIKRFPKEGASHEIHYLRGDISRENCFSCEMSNTNRVSDFTFGDYWAIEIEHPEFIVRNDPALSIRKGINCMMINTEKGMQYLSKLQEKMVMYEVDMASIRSVPRLLNGVLLNDKYEAFLKKRGMKKHPEFAKNDAVRMKAFEQFKNKAFAKLSPEFCGYKGLCEGAKRYDAVVTGSDQLWSPAGLPTNFYNLMFVPNHIRKISYASSFGVGQIPWYQKKRTADFLKRLDYISMRENRGSEIVKELTGLDAPVILDPVFNFDKEQWEKLIPIRKERDTLQFLCILKKVRKLWKGLHQKLNVFL